MYAPAVEVVCRSTPQRLNEDTWIAAQTGPLDDRIVIAAIDGATTRMTAPALQQYLDTLPVRLTPAALSARVARDAMLHQIATAMPPDLRTLMLEANSELGRLLISIFGDLSLDGMQFPPEVYNTLAHDPRLVRLGLPASAATVAEYDPAAHTLRYAHVSDTLLLVAYRDGRVEVPTYEEKTAEPDTGIKQMAQQLRAEHPDKTFEELLHMPEVMRVNLHNALYHNFVDEHGLPQPSRGAGVLNGQPELRYFVQTGQVDLDNAMCACVMTDGLEWPPDADEIFTEDAVEAAGLREDRIAYMASLILEHGLAGYLERLWQAKTDDPDHERYPRMKTHDDATGVMLRFA